MINFTPEHDSKLKSLFLELGFSGEVLQGKFGANSYTTWDLLHNTSLTSLRGLNKSLKAEVAALEDVDEWTASEHLKLKASKTKKWNEYVNLLIGYKIHQEELSEQALKAKQEKAKKLALLSKAKEAKEIEAINNLSLEDLDKKIAELE